MACPNCGSAAHVSCDPLDQAANQVANTVAKQGPDQREEWMRLLLSTADEVAQTNKSIEALVKQWPKTGDEGHFALKKALSSISLQMLVLDAVLHAKHSTERSE